MRTSTHYHAGVSPKTWRSTTQSHSRKRSRLLCFLGWLCILEEAGQFILTNWSIQPFHGWILSKGTGHNCDEMCSAINKTDRDSDGGWINVVVVSGLQVTPSFSVVQTKAVYAKSSISVMLFSLSTALSYLNKTTESKSRVPTTYADGYIRVPSPCSFCSYGWLLFRNLQGSQSGVSGRIATCFIKKLQCFCPFFDVVSTRSVTLSSLQFPFNYLWQSPCFLMRGRPLAPSSAWAGRASSPTLTSIQSYVNVTGTNGSRNAPAVQ